MKTKIMNIKKSLFWGALSAVALTSCVGENVELSNISKGTGEMELSVDIQKPQSRAKTEVQNFPVEIYDATGKQVFSYNTVADVPSKITMSVGNYTVVSHTPGQIQKKMFDPFYRGSKAVEILPGVTSPVEVICKMQNSCIKVTYDSEFTNVFTEWTITVDDGSETALEFSNSFSGPIYYLFEEGVRELTVIFRGKTKDGNTVVAQNTLTKGEENEHYDDGKEYFSGGDILILNFKPVESTEGSIISIVVTADISFTEDNENINVVVVDKPGFDEGGGDPDPGPGPGNDKITLNLPNNMTVSATTDKSLGDTYIKCDEGIKSIMVNIQSTSDEMIESLSKLNTNYHVDFIAGAEVVGSKYIQQEGDIDPESPEGKVKKGAWEENPTTYSIEKLFLDLNKPLSVPTVGDIEYTFPIGNFFGLLGFLSGTHTFNLVIEDQVGNTKTGELVFTVE